MKLFVLVAAALVAFVGIAKAEPPQFFLKPDGTVEQRVAAVESDVAKLQDRIAALELQLGTVAAKPKAAPPSKVRYSVCVNGRCTIYEVDAGQPIPAGATLLSAGASSPAATGDLCPCGESCPCAGLATAFAPSAGSDCASGSCSSARSGWYFGKNLGRRR